MKQSQSRTVVSGAQALFGITSALRDLRVARRSGDKLLVADAIVSLAAVCTGLAIAYRALRHDGEQG